MSGTPMKLILTHEVTGLGAPGDVITVKDGYGRNYLLPRGYAIAWTKGAEKQVESIRKARKAREIRSLGDAKAAATKLATMTVHLRTRAGERRPAVRLGDRGGHRRGGHHLRRPGGGQAQDRDPHADQDRRRAQGLGPAAPRGQRDAHHRRGLQAS